MSNDCVKLCLIFFQTNFKDHKFGKLKKIILYFIVFIRKNKKNLCNILYGPQYKI